MITDIIKELRENNSSNYKKEVLLKHKDNELWRTMLMYTYNSNWNYYLKKISDDLDYGSGTIESLSTEIFMLLEEMADKKLRGNTGLILVEELISNLTFEDGQALRLILGRDIKCGINVSTINKVYDDYIPTTKYMRCSKLDEKTIKNISYPAICQLKSDGLFCYAIKENNKVRFMTRNGTQFDIPSIENELLNIEDDNFVLSGELLVINEDGTAPLDRKTGNGLINSFIKREDTLLKLEEKKRTPKVLQEIKQKEQDYEEINKKIYLDSWDLTSIESWYSGIDETPYIARYDNLYKTITGCTQLKLIKTQFVDDIEEAKKVGQQYIDSGFEGAILKDSKGIWKDGTSKVQLKIKAILDADLLCVGTEEGTNKNIGKIGSLKLVSKCGKLKVNVGTGLSDKNREQSPSDFIDKVIEVQYNEVIKSKSKDTYSLFLPVFIEVREKTDYDSLEDLK